MASTAPAKDPYRRRREAGAASRELTRQRLLTAADSLFRERGYAATTVSAIAEHAGVSLQTLYLAWENKRALLRAAADASATDTVMPLTPEDLLERIRTEFTADADRQTAAAFLGALSRLYAQIATRAAPYWRMYRQGAATDAELRHDWDDVLTRRRRTMGQIAREIPRPGLRADLSPDAVGDTLWAIASPDVHLLLTTAGGYTAEQFESWLRQTLTASLCA